MKNILTEELKQILYLTNYKRGVVISEQIDTSKLETVFDLSGYRLKITESFLYLMTSLERIPINGVVNDFKVDPKTRKIIDTRFIDNQEFIEKIWSFIPQDIKPIQTQSTYKFIGIIPPGFPDSGSVKIYTGNIVEEDISVLESLGVNLSKDGTISPSSYIKKKGDKRTGIYVRLYPGGKNIPPLTRKAPSEKENAKDFMELNLESPFEFDSTSLTSESESKFQEFINSIKNNYKGATGDIEVICSSSIDGDPNSIIKGGLKRFDYDKELSEKRAKVIVDRLKKSLPETKLNFIPKGIGQTDKFAPGKKFPEVKNQQETSPNRRLIIRLPKVEKI